MKMSETVNTLQKEEPLVFINECLPQLVAGNYNVTADLVVNNNVLDKVTKDFWVDAPRFVLNPADIYSIYPPRESTGRFETTLPHIVFNRRTLPWERTIDGKPIDGKPDDKTEFHNDQGHAPWMGLLLLNEDEIKGTDGSGGAIKIVSRSLKDIFNIENNKTNGLFAPEISIYNSTPTAIPTLSPWDDMDSTCQVIDIPFGLFKAIIPQKDDLPFLGHVRHVLVDGHKESADIDDAGYFSTLICNRLPTRNPVESKSTRNTVFLVSLEGFHNYFKDPNSITSGKVTLVVLTSWSFTVAAGKNFKELCEGLHVSPFRMNYPSSIKDEDDLAKAYNYGYTLLPHKTREGTDTFSWYRGPFNPNFLPANSKTKTFASSDEALRFDRKTGLFDISYAAAWQLGRLLALKDKVFSTALYQWKIKSKRKIFDKAAKEQINALLPKNFSPSEDVDPNSLEDLMKDFIKQNYSKDSKDKPQKPFSNKPEEIQTQFTMLAESHEDTDGPPKEVTDWLGKLFLLYGVPLNYLLPHENYLVCRNKVLPHLLVPEDDINAKEALGTFYIDYDWVEALLGGALSIVSSHDSLALLKMLEDGKFLPENLRQNKEIKDNQPSGNNKLPDSDKIKGHITGFLLRSELVSGWKGIKVFPKDASGVWMGFPLRIERIADDIKLCMFSGKVQQILIIQPPEGIHFGVDEATDKKSFEKRLRKTVGTVNTVGTVLDESIRITFHNDNDKQVLNFSKIASDLQKQTGSSILFSSADFAFQMLESPIMYVLNIKDQINEIK